MPGKTYNVHNGRANNSVLHFILHLRHLSAHGVRVGRVHHPADVRELAGLRECQLRRIPHEEDHSDSVPAFGTASGLYFLPVGRRSDQPMDDGLHILGRHHSSPDVSETDDLVGEGEAGQPYCEDAEAICP